MIIDNIFEEYINFTPLSKRTKELYIKCYNDFWSEHIGCLELNDLNYTVVQNCLNELLKIYNYNTVKLYKSSMMKFITISEAKDPDYLFKGKNLLYIGKPPKKRNFNPNIVNEFLDLVEHIENSSSKYKQEYLVILWIGFYTGMRISEVIVLKKEDINLKKREIYIRKSKTPDGIRIVYIPKPLKNIIVEYIKKLQTNELFSIKPSTLSSYISNFSRPRNYTIHFHSLRELFVKTMLSNGANIESVRCILGHANASTTLNIYLKTDPEEVKKEMLNVYDDLNIQTQKT